VSIEEPRVPRTSDEELLGADLPTVRSEISDDQRVERMRAELDMGFDALRGTRRAVSVFGSAREVPGSPRYEQGREIGRRLGEAGFTVITGGGPGLMEAANRGAQEAGAHSIGLNIELPFEQEGNPYQDQPLNFHYFFTRKVMFVRYASAFVVLPGGFGTLDELFEALCLIQTRKVRHFPVLLVGTDFWGPMAAWIQERLVEDKLISPGDVDLFRCTDDLDEVIAVCAAAASDQWGTATGSA
jgi:hypothetical protein